MSINLDAFGNRDLQHCRTILQMYRDAGGIAVADLIAAVSAGINSRSAAGHHATIQTPPSRPRCPHCGTTLHKCSITGDVYCQKCRYSHLGGD